jgi:hypothetical protein
MSTLSQIVDGLVDTLKTINALEGNVLRDVRRPSSFPAAIVVPDSIPEYDLGLAHGGGRFNLLVTVLVGTADSSKQLDLFPFIDWSGSSSVAAAIQANQSLGLTDVDASVASVDRPGDLTLPGPDEATAFAVTFTVLIIASPE